jgi:hypothetical protein
LTALQFASLLLLLVGLGIWLAIGSGRGIGTVRWGIILLSAAVAAVPSVSRTIAAVLDRLRHPSRKAVRWATILIALAAASYFTLSAFLQDRDFYPKTHDDSSYLIQMQMLAHGRLWMPAHPLADFVDSFYLIVRPVYASQYFPGTALMYVPTIWLHLGTWVMPVLAAGAVVGLMYAVVIEMVDGVAGVLAALWVVSLSWFRMTSILLMSQVPALLLGLIMIWAWMRWRDSRRVGWLLLIGAATGWAAITRPVDALCFAIPLGMAIAWDLRRQPLKRWMNTAAWIVIAASPFLAIQVIADKGVTGHYFQTPFRLYLDRDVPGTAFGFPAYDPAVHPQSVLPQKQEYYRDWVVPFIKRHQPGQLLQAWIGKWLPEIVDTTMPARILLPLAAVGLLGLTDRRRWVLWATLPLFVIFYLFYTIFLEHYAISLIPAIVLLSLLGVTKLEEAWPRLRPRIASVATTLIVVICVTSLWEVNRWITPTSQRIDDETFRSPALRAVNEGLAAASDSQKPAVILFRYHPGDNFFEEPVYNCDVAWPDDATIIRAHDLGPKRDRQIVEYYAARMPRRVFYLFDAKSNEPVRELGSSDNPTQILSNLAEAHGPAK